MQRYPRPGRHAVFLLILLSAGTLRFLPLFDYQFTYDEIATLQRVGYDHLADLIKKGVRIDAHPGLIQIFVYLITRVSSATWLIKLPFILMSLGAITYGYAFGARNFSRVSGLAGALILAFSLPFVYHAPVARMYSSGIFFSLGMLYHFGEIVWRQQVHVRHHVFFALFMALGAFNHHINALYAATLYGAGLLILPRARLKAYLIAGACTILCYLPHLPVTLYQLGIGGIGYEQGGWLSPPQPDDFLELLNIIFGTGGGLVVMTTLLLAVVMWGYRTERLKKQFFLAAVFTLNFLVVYLYSVLRATIYQHTVLLFAGTGLVMGFSSAIDCRREKLNQVLLLLMAIWLIHQTYFRKAYLRQGVKTVFEFQFEETARVRDSLAPEKVLPLFLEADSVMRLLYSEKYRMETALLKRQETLLTGGNGLHELALMVQGRPADHIALASSMPIHQAIVREEFPFLTRHVQTQGIHYKMYSRKPGPVLLKDDPVLLHAGDGAPGPFRGGGHIPREGLFCEGHNEFPYGWEARYTALPLDEGLVLIVGCEIESDEDVLQLETCISVTDSSGEGKQYAAAAASVFTRKGNKKTLFAQLYIGHFHINRREGDLLKIYLWNRGAEQFILRSFDVKLVDHWHEKWHFWD